MFIWRTWIRMNLQEAVYIHRRSTRTKVQLLVWRSTARELSLQVLRKRYLAFLWWTSSIKIKLTSLFVLTRELLLSWLTSWNVNVWLSCDGEATQLCFIRKKLKYQSKKVDKKSTPFLKFLAWTSVPIQSFSVLRATRELFTFLLLKIEASTKAQCKSLNFT